MKLALYRFIMFVSKPLIRPILFFRRLRGLETKWGVRKGERFGEASVPRPKDRVFWFNAASVGESNSILPIIDRILKAYPDVCVLVTTTTTTSAEIMGKKLSDRRAYHQYLPVDRRSYVDRFFAHWRPSVGIFVDSDFWPNLILSARAHSVPLVLLNGRVSEKSFLRWKRCLPVAKKLMSAFIYGFAKSEEDRKRVETMGISVSICVGNLKYGVPPLSYNEADLEKIGSEVGERPVWVASSTHEGEEEMVLDAHATLKKVYPDALLVIAPRHPVRGPAIGHMVHDRGFKVARRSAGEGIGPLTDVYVADTMGELGLFYRLSEVVFVGGSLLSKLSGHNPMEPARLSSAVLSGPNVSSFEETYGILKAEDAVIIVGDGYELGAKILSLFQDPDLRRGCVDRAFKIAEREAAVIDRTMDKLQPILDSLR